MTATVEIRLAGGDLGATMSQMRVWLDHGNIKPHAFRKSQFPSGLALRVDFSTPSEAAAFAEEFGGRVIGTTGLRPEDRVGPKRSDRGAGAATPLNHGDTVTA